MWKFIEPGYYVTLESCLEAACDGEKIIDEIVQHYLTEGKERSERTHRWIVIDTHYLSMNGEAHLRFRRKMQTYRVRGFDIDETF
ncbi:hypothetical protein DFQ01_108193 [Paenibacillus cellulosilyticus]|uniref:Uncharacterized protein n=1 Tax=Paenibacillus cellulosilyticus TaxID=375489 RepID=A0A2V2YTZ4_9BACL|nr:hypothetical protein [Paenibacillus cellulosilyticus]PWW02914.1 hypothetical protein DFQ01_108193 [Paenibacillus cellulosilyticus]QKS45822.1 hypothetical protein HUB94_16280 [Paenibacillus cellulosilyticus]